MEILGVTNDFYFRSLHDKIQPTIKKIQAELSSIFPELTPDFYKYNFLEETYARPYEKDERTGRIILNFAIVAILLATEYLRWILLSAAVACPVAWIIMHRWLQGFAYRTGVSWWIFALAILFAFVITFATVTWQSLKTARTNPVDALRYE